MSNAKNNPESTWKSITSLLSAGCKVRWVLDKKP